MGVAGISRIAWECEREVNQHHRLARAHAGRRRHRTRRVQPPPGTGSAAAAIRLLALTGCRRGEALDLRWHNIGADALNLEDSKTGPRTVPLGEAAREHIAAPPGPHGRDAFLFPGLAEGRGAYSLTECWRTVCEDAGLGRLRLHDLRHTAASQAVMAGENLPLVGRLLGHRKHRTSPLRPPFRRPPGRGRRDGRAPHRPRHGISGAGRMRADGPRHVTAAIGS